MRKVLSIILCLALCVSLCGCVPAQQNDIEEENDNSYENWENTEEDPPRKTEEELWQEEYDEVVAYCEECVARGDYLGALNYSKEKAEGDAGYESLYAKYARLFVDKKLAEAKGYADKREFVKAIEVLEEANRTYGCMEFGTAMKEYEEFMPRKLTECHILAGERYERLEKAEDCFGSTYENAFGFETNSQYKDEHSGYIVFFLDGKFVNLSGIYAANDEMISNSTSIVCRIYGDEKLLYESVEIVGRTAYPISINVDITGIKQLRIEGDVICCSYGEHCRDIFDLSVS